MRRKPPPLKYKHDYEKAAGPYVQALEQFKETGRVPLNGPKREVEAIKRALGDKLPKHLLECEGRGAGMIATFTRGKGEVFNGGSTE